MVVFRNVSVRNHQKAIQMIHRKEMSRKILQCVDRGLAVGLIAGMLLFAGLSAAGGQFTITAAYTHAPAREVSVYDYTQIVFAAALGFIFFSQIPDFWSIIGYCIIAGVAVWMFVYTARKDRSSKAGK